MPSVNELELVDVCGLQIKCQTCPGCDPQSDTPTPTPPYHLPPKKVFQQSQVQKMNQFGFFFFFFLRIHAWKIMNESSAIAINSGNTVQVSRTRLFLESPHSGSWSKSHHCVSEREWATAASPTPTQTEQLMWNPAGCFAFWSFQKVLLPCLICKPKPFYFTLKQIAIWKKKNLDFEVSNVTDV